MGMKIKHLFLIVNHSITIVNQDIVQEAATKREFIGSSKNSNSKDTPSSKTKSVFTGREMALRDAKSHEVESCLARTVINSNTSWKILSLGICKLFQGPGDKQKGCGE